MSLNRWIALIIGLAFYSHLHAQSTDVPIPRQKPVVSQTTSGSEEDICKDEDEDESEGDEPWSYLEKKLPAEERGIGTLSAGATGIIEAYWLQKIADIEKGSKGGKGKKKRLKEVIHHIAIKLNKGSMGSIGASETPEDLGGQVVYVAFSRCEMREFVKLYKAGTKQEISIDQGVEIHLSNEVDFIGKQPSDYDERRSRNAEKKASGSN